MSPRAQIRRWLCGPWRLSRGNGAAIVLGEPVAHWSCHTDSTGIVRESGHLPERNRVIAAVAPAELSAFINCRAAENLRASTGNFIGHATAVAEAI